ncbi:proline-rich domain-containing protein [Streptomyces griseus]|uniref:proline-rich domain-containing protein n=1 Tax=Streptomyces griseus TaxID=1911 RepID=UPI00056C781E|nr:proline-rich domain-containing protein [Streptomyces griseus]
MSYGDPNNPYGAPQGQQQPGYGYPEQQPPAPGYGYPQAPPVGAYAGAAAPTTMPGTVNTARVLLWIIVGLQIIGVALFAFAAVTVNAAKNDDTLKNNTAFQDLADQSSGMIWAMTVFALAWAVFAIVLATKFNSGRNGVRITLLVFGIITAVLGIYPFVVVGLIHTVLAILVAVFVGNANGKAWFNRPQY